MKIAYSLLFISILLFSCRENTPAQEKEVIKEVSIDSISTELENIEKPNDLFSTVLDTLFWSELISLDPSIKIDIKYATEDNFVKEQMYDCGRCFLRKEVANRLITIHKKLKKDSMGLLLFDCYRPRPIQQKLWEKVPDARYVTPPEKGSMHNRGNAVDLTIIGKDGIALDMGTSFDYFGKEAHHDFLGHSEKILTNRSLLKTIMEENGFRAIRTEWWHYSYTPKIFGFSDELWGCE